MGFPVRMMVTGYCGAAVHDAVNVDGAQCAAIVLGSSAMISDCAMNPSIVQSQTHGVPGYPVAAGLTLHWVLPMVCAGSQDAAAQYVRQIYILSKYSYSIQSFGQAAAVSTKPSVNGRMFFYYCSITWFEKPVIYIVPPDQSWLGILYIPPTNWKLAAQKFAGSIFARPRNRRFTHSSAHGRTAIQ